MSAFGGKADIAHWYVGGNVGYSWGNASIDYSQSSVGGAPIGPGPFAGPTCGVAGVGNGCLLPYKVHPQSFAGGGQLGYNYQTGWWVLGFETDIQWRNGGETTSTTFSFGDFLALKDDQKWFGTVRGRVGLTAPSSNWLFYLTGGLAYGSFEHQITQIVVANIANQTFSSSPTKVGWTLGGGVEVAVARNWSIGAEYLYLDFGTDTINGLTPYNNVFATTFHDHSQIARVKLNYQFH
jgi:outer membrane immunogenic protein